jgi:cell division protein FtsW (lipid II flippase)
VRLGPSARATFSTAASRRRSHGWRHAFQPARILPLAAALLVALAGIGLIHAASLGRIAATVRTMRRGEVRDLNAVRSAGELDAALARVLDHPGDRRFAAARIFAVLPAGGDRPALSHVGALGAIRVPAAPLAARSDLETYRVRAAAALASQAAARGAGRRRDDPRPASLSLLTPDQLRELKPAFVVRAPGGFHRAFLLSALLFLAAWLALHVAAHAGGRLGDPLLLPPVALLASLGFVALTSLRDPLRDQMLFARFAQGAALGAAGFVAAGRIAYERSVLRRLSLVPLLGALMLSGALVWLGHGPSGSDAKVNLFGVQPIEVIRLLLVLFLAGWFAERWQLLRELHEPRLETPWLRLLRLPPRQHALPAALGVAAAIAFFFLQRDLGPALVLLALFLCLYAVSRGGAALALVGLAGIAAAFAVSYAIGFPATVSLRTTMWLSPWENGLARGDQVAHALWGFAAGGVSGTGIGLGMPALVPAAHTDLILATVGEELGLIGVLVCAALFALLVARGLGIARRAPDPYTMFLALGVTLGIALQTLLIAAGVLGLAPLSGVGTPFLSYGRSALILNLVGLGILWSISASAAERDGSERRLRSLGAAQAASDVLAGEEQPPSRAFAAAFAAPLRLLALVLAVLAAVVVARAAWVQLVRADATLGRGQLARQADGELRYQYDPRLQSVAAALPRGDILDRNGVLLATSRWSELQQRREEYRQLGVEVARACLESDPRHYPFGPATYHLLGDWVSRRNWGASNTAFLERGEDDFLNGYDDHARAVTIRDPRTGERRRVARRNLAELVPLWRHRWQPRHRDVRALMERDRDLRATLDVRLQLRAVRLLGSHIRAAGLERGALVALDPDRGEVLASVSWPVPEGPLRGRARRLPSPLPGDTTDAGAGPLFDRARFGLYPPGSTFKLVTAAAALERDPALARATFPCRELPDGRAGAVVGGRAVRDDPTDRAHGAVDLERGTVVSCNAYFAQLGGRVGWAALERMAGRFGIGMGDPEPAERAAHLIEASYGQAHVLASPLRMARVAGAVAGSGTIAGLHWVSVPRDSEAAVPAMSAATARRIAGFMRAVVERGTAQRLAAVSPPIAGKTGTAQVAGDPSHSWFVGYAPSGPATRRLAFAVLIENGGYGGVRAAQVAGELVAAARELGLVETR